MSGGMAEGHFVQVGLRPGMALVEESGIGLQHSEGRISHWDEGSDVFARDRSVVARSAVMTQQEMSDGPNASTL
jgi:hypothetical protein